MRLRDILLVEDNTHDVEFTLKAMAKNKLANKIVVVKDGVEALEYLRREGKYKDRETGLPSVVLMDIKMPRMDGIETLGEIRNDEKLKLLPVVMLTSSREESDLVTAYKLGVNAFVLKPVEFNEFVEASKIVGMFWGVLNEIPNLKE